VILPRLRLPSAAVWPHLRIVDHCILHSDSSGVSEGCSLLPCVSASGGSHLQGKDPARCALLAVGHPGLSRSRARCELAIARWLLQAAEELQCAQEEWCYDRAELWASAFAGICVLAGSMQASVCVTMKQERQAGVDRTSCPSSGWWPVEACVSASATSLDLHVLNAAGEYGVRPDHSTFEIIRQFARMMRHSVVATPPRQECELSCWVSARRYGFDTCAGLSRSPAVFCDLLCICCRVSPEMQQTLATLKPPRVLS